MDVPETLCDAGCVPVYFLMEGEEDGSESDEEVSDDRRKELQRWPCWAAVTSGEYGHIRYAVASYCVQHGHLACLKYLAEHADWLEYHADLAEVAAREGHEDVLDYILSHMGDVRDPRNPGEYVPLVRRTDHAQTEGRLSAA